jgi:RNA polymerase sigma-70 factor (ECF subfamily)
MSDDEVVAELLDRLKAGDQAALAELFARHKPRLRRMVEVRLDARLNGRVSPSDVLQEAYIDAVKRLRHFFDKPDESFFGWLRLVVGQRLADVHREHLGAAKRDAGQEVSMNRGVPAAGSACLAGFLVGDFTSPSHVAQRAEALAAVEAALEQLEPLDREVLALRHFEELSNNEVAEALGIQRAAASKRYVRALARLREVFESLPGPRDQT